MLALAISTLFLLFANCPLSSILMSIAIKLTEIFVILIGKTSVTIFLGSHQTCGRLYAIPILLNKSSFNLMTRRIGPRTKGFVVT